MLKLAVLVSGGGTNLQAIIDAIENGTIRNTSIELVIASNACAYALQRASRHGIEGKVISPKEFSCREDFNDVLLQTLLDLNPDLIVLAGFLVALPKTVVESFKNKIINIHPSLIPSFCGKGYYGIYVHEAALKRGVKLSGATVHYVDEDLDTGPIILQKAVEVKEDDTPQSLQKRVMEEAEQVILPKAIDMIANS